MCLGFCLPHFPITFQLSQSSDFEGISHPFIFRKNKPPVPQEVTFTTKNDEIPEANETFLIKAIVTTGNETAEVIPPEVRLTILANDDSGGVFAIANVRKRLKPNTNIKTFVSTRTALITL